jgi:hypothetical protein
MTTPHSKSYSKPTKTSHKPKTSTTAGKPFTGAFSLFFATVGQHAVVAGLLLYTVKDAEGMPAPVRAVLFGGVLLFLTRMLTNGLDLAALF